MLAAIICSLSLGTYAHDKVSAKGIFEGSLDDDVQTINNQRYEGIEASIVLYDAQGKTKVHNLHQSLATGKKFKIHLKSTVTGLLQISINNADGTQDKLPNLYVQRGQEIYYPQDTTLELAQQTGKEELVLTLIPENIDLAQVAAKGIFEGELEDTPQASYIVQAATAPIVKRIILKHHE